MGDPWIKFANGIKIKSPDSIKAFLLILTLLYTCKISDIKVEVANIISKEL
jgi:hypothetical protein